jgi:hypothetical protein
MLDLPMQQQNTSPTAVAPELTVLDSEPGLFWYGAWQNMSFVVWEQSATLEAVERIDRAVPARLKIHPRLSTVHIATLNAGMPSSAARSAFGEAAKRWAQVTGCVAVVVEYQGFAASALRSMVTAIQLLAGSPFPMRVHGSFEEAVPWLVQTHARTTNVRLAPDALMQVLQAARKQVG